MKGALDRTKVVLRHLPPSISQSSLLEQVDSRFSGRYNWVCFRPGKTSQKHQSWSRAYIDFKRPDDVIEFAEFFGGHVFVNEKGTQFKTVVEYAPSQCVPKQWSKKDGREGTILKDPEYLEFLEFLAKPVENLPSAEIQLERKEAERAGAAKEPPVVTPLMDYVRQKRAAKSGARRSASNGKSTRRVSGASTGSSSSSSSKRGSEKRRISTTMYVLRDSAKITSGKDKSTFTLVRKQDDLHLSDKSVASAAAPGNDALEEESGALGPSDSGKKTILLLKGKEKEILHMSGDSSMQLNTASPFKNLAKSALKQNQRHEASGKIIRSILRKDNHKNQSSLLRTDQQNQLERDKRSPRSPSFHLLQKDASVAPDGKVPNDLRKIPTEKQERRMKNKDRPDRVVWTHLRHSDGAQASDDVLSSSASQSAVDSVEGSYRHGGRRGSAHLKDSDGSSLVEGKPLRRGGGSGFSSHEKRVWIQKSSSGS